MAGLVALATRRFSKLPRAYGPNKVATVSSYVVGSILRFLNVDIEMVQPEVDHDFIKLALGVDVPEKFGLDVFRRDDTNGRGKGGQRLRAATG